MPEAKQARFCSQCGAQIQAGAAFCTECGTPVGKTAAPPARKDPEALRQWAPLIVVGVLLALGGIVVGIGYSNQPPPNQPIGRNRPPAAQAAAPGQQMPSDHPPVEIPEDVLKVIVRMEKLAAEQPGNLEAWKQLAFVQYRAGQIQPKYLDKSEASYLHVLGVDANDLDALRGLGNVAYDRNDPTKALEHYKRYLEIEPGDKAVRTDMGTMLLSAQQPAKAIDIYRGVLQEDPTFFQAQFNLAIAYRAGGEDELAVAALQRAKEIAPDDDARKRVEALLAHVGGAPSGQAAPTGSLRDAIEAVFRSHPIVGPRIDAIRWESDQKADVVLREFPMQGMPPMVREKFISRLTSGVRESKKRFAFTDPVSIDIVDATSGETMVNISD